MQLLREVDFKQTRCNARDVLKNFRRLERMAGRSLIDIKSPIITDMPKAPKHGNKAEDAIIQMMDIEAERDAILAALMALSLINIDFSEKLPLSPLHWLLADKEKSIVIESMKDGLHLYDNPVGVLTNNPPFDYQLFNLNNYRSLSNGTPENHFSNQISLDVYSRGMGGLGLPGVLSSVSRFVKATFTKMNAASGDSESESISQFFHILGSVEQQKGVCDTGEGKYEYTIYSSCCNVDKGIYYYRTYEDSQITAVNMNKEDLDRHELVSYPVIKEQQINYVN